MNWIKKMIAKQCPNGVEKVKLGELGAFENIGTDKKIVEGEQLVTLLNYVDIYHHKKITPSIPNMVVSANDKKIKSCTVEKGDIFVTPTSETPDDIGHSAVITQSIPNAVYSYHIMRYRQFTHNMTTSYYINYCFDSISVQKQIQKKAQGLTRFGLSKDKFSSIEIPLPPLSIQEEIVSVLDKFSELIEKTDEEIALRQKQYEYYREKLLTFEENVRNVKLGKVCDKTENIKWQNTINSYQYIDLSSVDIFTHKIISTTVIDKESAPSRAQQIVKEDDVIFATTRPTQMRVCLVPAEYDGEICSTGYCVLRPKTDMVLSHFIFYVLTTSDFKTYLSNHLTMGSYPSISNNTLKEYEIPLPPLSVQEEIVSVLDKFETLISKLKEERELRQKQYEYYREKLLTF